MPRWNNPNCGFQKGTKAYLLSKANAGHHHTAATKAIISKKLKGRFRGENHPGWKGGQMLGKRIRQSAKYYDWRSTVLKRDNFTCIWCGQSEKDIQVDHIKPFALFPDLRFELSNGRTLCITCHRKTDTWGYNTKKLEGFE